MPLCMSQRMRVMPSSQWTSSWLLSWWWSTGAFYSSPVCYLYLTVCSASNARERAERACRSLRRQKPAAQSLAVRRLRGWVLDRVQLKPGFHSNAIACIACVAGVAYTKTARNASACVSCGFRLRNARDASDCVWMETGLDADHSIALSKTVLHGYVVEQRDGHADNQL